MRRWLRNHRFSAALFVAFAVHLATPPILRAGLRLFPPRRFRPALRAEPHLEEIDVEVSELPNEHPPLAHDDTEVPEAPLALNDRRPDEAPENAPVHERVLRVPAEPVQEGADDSPDSFPAPEPDATADPMRTAPSLVEEGGHGVGDIGAPWGSLPPDALPPDRIDDNPAPTHTRKRVVDKDAARRAVDRGLRNRDAQLGLDFPAASAIAATLREAVRGSDAPFDCQGSFSVAVSAAGKVTRVALGGFSGGDSGTWHAIAHNALGQLSSRVFEMKSSFAKGALVGVTIKSEQKMPGGGVGRTGATFSFDVADVGAKPVRVVHMSFSARPVE